jgi:twitching motility protein PilT
VNRIDRFLKPLLQSGGTRMTMASGRTVTMTTRTGERPMTIETLSAQQINSLLQEIVPAGGSVAAGKDTEFAYDSPFGRVSIHLTHPEGQATMIMTPAAGGEAKPAAASPLRPQAAPEPQRAAAPSAPPPAVAKKAPPKPPPAVKRGPPSHIDELFRRMVGEGCSDLHVSSGSPPLFRKDGDIVPLGDDEAIAPDTLKGLLYAITPAKYQKEFEEVHDTDFSYEIADLSRFRCNLFLDRNGIGGVFRTIPTKVPNASDLGLSKAMLDLCHLNKGLVLVTGPTGSGKSTTLAAMIDYINHNLNAHIITIEDPIEFVHKNRKCLVNQREIGNHTQGFKHALRAALREDPDIVLVGEMRDLETVAIAIETAETGHLVFGTLHTNTAPSTVDRMIDQFPADRQNQIRTMLAESLKGVISQMLLRRNGGGRVAAHELLLVSSAISNLIREGKTFQIQSIMQVGKGTGMVCMNDTLVELVKTNVITAEEALTKAVGKTELKGMLARAGVKIDGAAAAAVEAAAQAS